MRGSKLIKAFDFDINIDNSDVLNIPRCTHDIPPTFIMISPDVLKISPMHSWYSPDVLNTPVVLMVSPDALNTHYIGCWLLCSGSTSFSAISFTMSFRPRPFLHQGQYILTLTSVNTNLQGARRACQTNLVIQYYDTL